jgi:flagellar biosynthesis protein FliQ
MGADRALGLMTDMLWTAALIAAPVLLVTLIVGLIISVFQVATQIQEITLSYVPKTLAAGLVLVLVGPWMISQLSDYARGLFLSIPSLGG